MVAKEPWPPWHEIITDGFYPRDQRLSPGTTAMVAARERTHKSLYRQHRCEFRLPVILREFHDLKSGINRRPLSIEDYEYDTALVLVAAQVVLSLKNGQRHRIIG